MSAEIYFGANHVQLPNYVLNIAFQSVFIRVHLWFQSFKKQAKP